MRQLRTLLRYDFLALRYAGQQLAAIAAFALLLAVVASIVFRRVGMGQAEMLAISPGMLILLFSFTGILAVRVLSSLENALERDGGALLGLILAGVDPWALYFAKFIRTALVVVAINVLILLLDSMFFGVNFSGSLIKLTLVTVLFSLGFSAVGTLLGLVAQAARLGELLLPLMLFPLIVPQITAAYELLNGMLTSVSLNAVSLTSLDSGELTGSSWYLMMVLFDILATVLSAVLFEFAVKE